jgi:AmmeMemoRadiSam system protein B
MHDTVRAPAVAGTFYPASAAELGSAVDRFLAAVPATAANARCPKALIVPHAGYVYSGAIAASAFSRVAPFGDRITRVVLIGPAHRVFVEGLVSPGANRLRTPLGELEVDTDALALLEHQLGIAANPGAHAREHSLEVELPFLQRVTPRAKIVPLAGTRAAPALVGKALDAMWGGPETLIVISSDLSHYHPYTKARALDESTAARIVALDATIAGEQACGSIGINGLLDVARRRGLTVELVDLRSSGDTAGSKDEVVGYGAFAIYEGAH